MKSEKCESGFKLINKVELVKKYGILILMGIIIIAMAYVKPNFLSVENLGNVLRQVSIIGLVAIGMTVVILLGGIDLSAGSVVALSGMLAAIFAKIEGMNTLVPIMVGCAAGLVIGSINGMVIAHIGIPSFIQTLGMMNVVRGIVYLISNAKPISGLSESFLAIGSGYFLGIPIPVIFLSVGFIVLLFVLNKTKFGRYIYAVGGNEDAALVSGIKVKSIKVTSYAICGLVAGLAGVLLTARVSAGIASAGENLVLDAVAAPVIGGVSFTGGEGKLWGTVLGFMLMGLLNNALDLLNVSSYFQLVVKGLIIITAVSVDVLSKRAAK